jgi:hypothetical protein
LNRAFKKFEFEKMYYNQNYSILKWEELNSKPHPQNLIFIYFKSKPRPKILFKKQESPNTVTYLPK